MEADKIPACVNVPEHCIIKMELKYFKVKRNYFQKVHRNKITSVRDIQRTR